MVLILAYTIHSLIRLFYTTLFISYPIINPIQDRRWGGEGHRKEPPTSFFPVTSTIVEISPQNLLTFSFNPFGTLM